MKTDWMSCFIIPVLCAATFSSCIREAGTISIADIPDTSAVNLHYYSNRKPLTASVLIKLPVGSIVPDNWLKECLVRQSNGLNGNLGKISAWLQKNDNAWLSKEGKGIWGWEEVPYWLRGYANTGYILNRADMIEEAKIWIGGVINSQRADGNFGPLSFSQKDSTEDFWPNMIMMNCLESYYEYTGDKRVLDLMTRYFTYQMSIPENKFISKSRYWQWVRGGDNLYSVLWLYNITGDKWLLELAEKIHRCTAPWSKRGNSLEDIRNWKEIREGMEWPVWYGDLIDWHNVNVAQGFREPAQYYQISHNKADLQAAYDNFSIIREHFGQVPGGMYGADENARPGYDDPRQGIETCGMVEQMNSNEQLLRITGDIRWADHTEEVAFNSYPVALMPDLRSLRYITSPNMVLNDNKNHRPGIQNEGPFLMMNPFSSRCCQHNHSQGWPYLVENLWMATPDNGLAAVIYAASTVSAKVGKGEKMSIKCTSNYPFEDKLTFSITTAKKVKCPLYFRIPAWCNEATLAINGKIGTVRPLAGKYVCITRTWKEGDTIILTLPMELKVRTWTKNHNSVSVEYGPLTFSLKIGEEYVRKESDRTAVGDSKWQKDADSKQWPSYEIHPTTNWNYGLVLDQHTPANSFSMESRGWPADNFPFVSHAAPIVLKAKAKKINAWKIDKYWLAGELKDSPVASKEPTEIVELIPMGAARLRISAFPVIGEGKEAKDWEY